MALITRKLYNLYRKKYKNNSWKKGAGSSKITCYECNKPGHIKAECQQLKSGRDKRKGLLSTWSDDEFSDDDEEPKESPQKETTNFYLMAKGGEIEKDFEPHQLNLRITLTQNHTLPVETMSSLLRALIKKKCSEETLGHDSRLTRDKLFDGYEAKFRLTDFRLRNYSLPREMNLDFFYKQDFRCFEAFKANGWEFFLDLKEPIYPMLIREFYANLKIDEAIMGSSLLVRGRRAVLIKGLLSELLKCPNAGICPDLGNDVITESYHKEMLKDPKNEHSIFCMLQEILRASTFNHDSLERNNTFLKQILELIRTTNGLLTSIQSLLQKRTSKSSVTEPILPLRITPQIEDVD
ncbi:zf-CCHC domain-containing protein [Senna tora]|uniref:Zf-CCHC domain-containing protein n=1 Tax=Senna tora TaxID=362788 RepID=A0A834TZT3_9FABA|nr:zf-CCHC domain-containing protein [Senna tora]